MPKKALDRLKRLNRKHLIIAGVMGAAIVVLLIVQLLSPERSIRAYCKEYEKQLATFSPHHRANKYDQAADWPF